MSPEELKKYSQYLAAGASAVQAADMARGVFTGKGQSWMPNWAAEKFKGIKNASGSNWWKSGKLPFGLRGTFMGAAPTTGATLGLAGIAGTAGFMGANALMDSQWGDEHGLGRNDFKGYGSNLYNLFNQPSPDITALGGPRAKGNIFNKGTIDASEFKKPTPVPTYNPPQGPAGFTQPVTQPIVQPTTPTWTPPPTPTQRNVTKFSPTRSTAIKGGRGGRGNVGGNRMKAGTSKNYGVTGRRVTGGR